MLFVFYRYLYTILNNRDNFFCVLIKHIWIPACNVQLTYVKFSKLPNFYHVYNPLLFFTKYIMNKIGSVNLVKITTQPVIL